MDDIRRLHYIGTDGWDRPCYTEEGSTRLWADVNLGNGTPYIHRISGDEMGGEPDYPIAKEAYEIITPAPTENPYKFTYQMLSRLRMDCDYFLGNGDGNPKNLWAGNVQGQISEMKKLYESLPKGEEPEWLSMKDIVRYEDQMFHRSATNEKLAKYRGEVARLESVIAGLSVHSSEIADPDHNRGRYEAVETGRSWSGSFEIRDKEQEPTIGGDEFLRSDEGVRMSFYTKEEAKEWLDDNIHLISKHGDVMTQHEYNGMVKDAKIAALEAENSSLERVFTINAADLYEQVRQKQTEVGGLRIEVSKLQQQLAERPEKIITNVERVSDNRVPYTSPNGLETADLSLFADSELEQMVKLLGAYANTSKHTTTFSNHFTNDMESYAGERKGSGVQVLNDAGAGKVFLSNGDFQKAMINNNGDLDLLISTPHKGHEGFAYELKERIDADWHESDIDYLKSYDIIEKSEVVCWQNIGTINIPDFISKMLNDEIQIDIDIIKALDYDGHLDAQTQDTLEVAHIRQEEAREQGSGLALDDKGKVDTGLENEPNHSSASKSNKAEHEDVDQTNLGKSTPLEGQSR